MARALRPGGRGPARLSDGPRLLWDLKRVIRRLRPDLIQAGPVQRAAFLAALNEALNHRELLKVKFDDLKDQKKELTPLLAAKSHSHLVTRVGNVVVLYRPKPVEEKPSE